MSLLELMKVRGIPMPPIETEDGLTAKDLMDKIRGFYMKLSKLSSESQEFMEGYHLELLHSYPQSMCTRHLTETAKQLITIIYFDSKPEYQPYKSEDPWPGYSYEDLAVMFVLSKATIHEAIRQKEAETKKLLAEVMTRGVARSIAMEELVKEEKQKILEEKQKENKQTTEQTPNTPSEEV